MYVHTYIVDVIKTREEYGKISKKRFSKNCRFVYMATMSTDELESSLRREMGKGKGLFWFWLVGQTEKGIIQKQPACQ
jgi:hypothetical protein